MSNSEIKLHVYDISRGLAQNLSQTFLGIHVEGVWHTGVYVYGQEYFYGGGIQALPPQTVIQQFQINPVKNIHIGNTNKSVEEFHAFLQTISHKYTMHSYDLFRNNCNNFSDEAIRFLTEERYGVPNDILDLPNRVLQTPIGRTMIGPMYNQMQQQMFQNMNQNGGNNNFVPFAGQNNFMNTNMPMNKSPEEKLEDLKAEFGSEVVDIFAAFEQNRDKGINSVVKLNNQVYICSMALLKSALSQKDADFSCVVLLFDSRKDKPIASRDLKLKDSTELFEIDEATTESCEEMLEISSTFLAAHAGKKILVASSNGNNQNFACLIAASLESSNQDSSFGLGVDMVSVLRTCSKSTSSFFVGYPYLNQIIENLNLVDETKMIKTLHPESPTNILKDILYDLNGSAELAEKVALIKETGINADDATIRQVLKSSNGDVTAAMNILL